MAGLELELELEEDEGLNLGLAGDTFESSASEQEKEAG